MINKIYCGFCDKETELYFRTYYIDKNGHKRYGAICKECNEKQRKRTIERDEMQNSLNNLKYAMLRVNETFHKHDAMNNFDALKIYPFDKSFDDMTIDIVEWADATIKEIKSKYDDI